MQVAHAFKCLQDVVVRLQRANGTLTCVSRSRTRGRRRGWSLVRWRRGFDDGLIQSRTYHWQSVNAERSVLAGERKRAGVASLLLLYAPNLVIQGIVQFDLSVVQNGEPMALRKVGVARFVLSAAGAWAAQISVPPGIAGGNRAAARALGRQWHENLVGTEQLRKLRAQPAHRRFQAIVEHVTDHRHSAAHPLAVTAQFRMVKLRQCAASGCHCKEESPHGVDADAIALRQIFNRLVAPWCESPW